MVFPTLLTLSGIITILLGGYTALFTCDLKKIVAFSTLSQLGFLVICLNWSTKNAVFLHLLCHGPFKALLFLVLGAGIHGCYGAQEARYTNPLCTTSTITAVLGTVSLLSLRGLPFLAGGISKHLLFAYSCNSGRTLAFLISFLLGVALTTAYVTKFFFLFLRPVYPPTGAILSLPGFVALPLLVLGFFAVTLGWVLGPYLVLNHSCLGLFDCCLIVLGSLLGAVGYSFLLSSVRFSANTFPDLVALSNSCFFRSGFRNNVSQLESSIFSITTLH